MNSGTVNALRSVIIFLFAFSGKLSAQDGLNKRPNVIINSNCHGYLEYLPAGYTGGTAKYPLIVYLNGIGSTGSGSNDDLENHFTGGNYPHEQQRNNTWPDAFTVNSETWQPLFITPQFITPFSSSANMPTPEQINDVINYAVAHYRIDTTRIYLIGSSQGGGIVWDYLGASSAYAKRIAAAVIFGGVSFPLESRANIIKHNRVAIWAFHNSNDPLVPPYFTNDYISLINQSPAPAITAKKTLFTPAPPSHLCWYFPLGPGWTENGLNIYQWLLQYQKPHTTANAGLFQPITLPTSSTQLNGSGTGPNGTSISYNWQKISGPAGGAINNATILNPIISNLQQGKYVYRLGITDNVSAVATSEVEILVNPSVQRIQAENFAAMSGVLTETTTDEGGGLNVGYIDQGDWMDYNITVSNAGNYKFRFRIASAAPANPQMKVKNQSGTVLATFDLFQTSGWQTWFTQTVNIPLAAGAQTIRLESSGAGGWNINWLEVESVLLTLLDVHFSLFNVNCSNGSVQFLWKTSGETNSGKFSIEKSNDGRTWTVITTLAAAGQSTSERSYRYTDNTGSSANFYRILEEGMDGRKNYSPVIKTNCGLKQEFSVSPNPVNDKAVITITSSQNSKLHLFLIDSRGSIVRKQEVMLPQGNNQATVNLEGLPKGMYVLQAQWSDQSKTVKLIKN